eukprot:1342716-Amorphochlora_amoeboformis.AAC.1
MELESCECYDVGRGKRGLDRGLNPQKRTPTPEYDVIQTCRENPGFSNTRFDAFTGCFAGLVPWDVITSHAFCQFFSNPQADRQGEPANTRGRRNSRVSDKSLNGEAGHGDGEGEKKKPKRSRAGLFFRGFAFSGLV